jgi:hypothetical protein
VLSEGETGSVVNMKFAPVFAGVVYQTTRPKISDFGSSYNNPFKGEDFPSDKDSPGKIPETEKKTEQARAIPCPPKERVNCE